MNNIKNGAKVWVLQTDKDKDAWVAGILIKKTKKRFLVKNQWRNITRYYAHIRERKNEI
tara:strand:+ start:143 stop:319 length:177 start_codon:yes stop_codon:yes gene_type:complete